MTDRRSQEALPYLGVIAAIMLGLYLSSLHSYILFHSLVEISTIAIGFTLFILAWNTRSFQANNYLHLLGICYAFIALIDLVHALAYKGMNVFPGYDSNLPTQLWIAARYLQAVTLCAAALFVARKVDNRLIFGVSAISTALIVTLVFFGKFPVCFIEGAGLTSFKIGSEYVISLLLLFSLFLLFRIRQHFTVEVFRLVATSILCTALSEVAFTAYVSVYGPANMVGHMLKLAAFYLIYRALVVTGIKEPFDLIFMDLKQAGIELQKVNETLEGKVRERTAALEISLAERKEAEKAIYLKAVKLEEEVSERQMAQKALQEQALLLEKERGRMDVILSALNTGLSLINQDMTIAWVNQKIRKMFPDREPVGQVCHLFYESRETICDGCGTVQAFMDGKVCESEQLVPATGRWYYIISQPIKDTTGRVVNVLEGITDITERKQAEENLHKLNRELRAISNCNQTLMRAEDEQTLLGEICRIVCEEAGYRMAWVGYAENDEARTVRPVAWAGVEDGYLADADITWADTELGRSPSGIAIRTGETVCNKDFTTESNTIPWRNRALERDYHSSIALPLKNENGNTFGILNIYAAEPNAFTPEEIRLLEELSGDLAFGIMVLRTRSERKQVEKKLIKSEASLRTLVQTIPDLIWLKDAQGIYLACNPMFERFFGASETEIVGKTDYDFVVRELADFFREHDRKAMAAGKPTSNEEWITFADDGHRALLDTAKTPMFDVEGNLIGVLGIGHDVTEQRSLENQLRQAQKIEAIGTLAGGIAHDFNNILSVIIGFGSILEMKMAKDDPLLDNVTQILVAADRAANLTRSMLAFSRKQAMEVKPLKLNELISGLGKMLRRLIREDIELRLCLTEDEVTVLADAGQIEQVLLNLTTNAKDSMPDRGSISITTELTELDDAFRNVYGYGEPGRYALITFADSGEGMEECVRQKIFEPFFTTKEVGKGTGLGLSVCYGIIKQHNGYILCDSEPGRGTTFRIYLPLSGSAVLVKTAKESDLPEIGTETILLAEDDTSLRTLTTCILTEFGYTVIEAENGEEAVSRFAERPDEIKLCLFDVIMPKRSGIEAYGEIKRIRPGMKVLFMSGYQTGISSHGGVVQECVELITKPISPRELLKRVREVLDRRSS